jgi:serine/threonine-protein kinase ATR
MHVADLRKELCENESGGFSDLRLSEESGPVLKTFRALNLGDESRPAKRRKTLPDSAEDVNNSTYQRLVVVLNGSTEDSPVLNLSNLHNIIELVACS